MDEPFRLDLITNIHSNVKILRLSSKCIMLNEIEDIEIENLFCIAGQPNLSKMTNFTDPLFTKMTTKEFLQQLKFFEDSSTSRTTHKYFSNRFNVQMNTNNSVLLSPNDDDDNKGNINEDFYLYKFQQIRLEQNEKISLPIFDMQIPYRDVYHCQIDPKKLVDDEKKSQIDTTNYTITAEVRLKNIFQRTISFEYYFRFGIQ